MKSFNLNPVPPFTGGALEQVLERWLSGLYQAVKNAYLVPPSAAPFAVTLAASPANITSSDAGFFTVTGGTITTITLTRQGFTVNLPITTAQIVVSAGDVLSITYTVAPTVHFWASFG